MLRRIAVILLLSLVCCSSAALASSVRMVPEGNRNAEQPPIPGASKQRTKETKSTFDLKYDKIIDLLTRDRDLVAKIKKVAAAYGIDPLHMIGALVGEHTYNVDAYDTLQSYYVKAASYAGNTFRFAYEGETVDQFVARPEFAQCNQFKDSDRLWTCRNDVWQDKFQGKRVDGKSFPNNRFSAVFFQPFYAGQTFGLGQINPLTALMLTDMVHRVSGFAKLDEKDASGVYKAIMDPDISLAYMAAIIRKSIDDYKTIAGVDISDNPGLTATLYNLGDSAARARALANRNAGGATVWPEENYYGWLINDRLKQLKGLL
ncbi:hypothetical protein H4S14_002724 [Agrobacterium vitis]|nr:hypothetical protein [Agrobacterium vitis]MBE1438967.1 hypothetical protein [Agrobacterium vitis]